MTATLRENDCFGAILRSNGGELTFISPTTGKIYATLDKDGLHVQRGSGKKKEKNTISLRALEVLVRELKKA